MALRELKVCLLGVSRCPFVSIALTVHLTVPVASNAPPIRLHTTIIDMCI